MKKIIMSVAIVCATAFAQAATVDWSVDNVYVPGSTESVEGGYYAYYFAESVSIPLASGQSALLSRETAVQNIKDGNTDFLSSAVSSAQVEYGYAAGYGVGSFAAGGASDNEVTGYLVIMSGDSKYAYVTGSVMTTIDSNEACPGAGFGDLTDTQLASNWMSVGGSTPAPEPTSGLLILVGMAGLALRRRRA